MKPPIRMVCGDCLRSVELSLEEGQNLPAVCPYCGGTIDSLLSEIETPTRDHTQVMPTETRSGETTPWIETWSKGTLGMIGRFQLREMLGDGGFGQVFQAYDPRLDRDVALKVLKQSEPGERVMERFFREARAAARLDHPNIVAVYDAGHDAGRCWIAYQFVSGRTLLRQRDQKTTDRTTSVRIIRDLADALDHAHNEGVFHRDLKPTNVIIDEQGRPRLTDFGLARRADLDSDLTRDGAILGTPAYMSPEQASGRSHLADERSDVYSLGVMFFELLCGRRPANLPSEAPAWMAKPKPGERLPSPRSLDRTIPAELDQICTKALASDPALRYSNARTLADELDAWLRREQSAKHRAHVLVGAVLGIAATLLLMSGLKGVRTPAEAPRVPIASAPAALIGPQAQSALGTQAEVPSPPSIKSDASPHRSDPVSLANRASVPAKDPHEILIGNRNRSSKVYHRSDCTFIPDLKNALPLANAEEAAKKGLRPCKQCNPPVAQTSTEPSPSSAP